MTAHRLRHARTRGTVLIVSMWIVLVLAGLVLVFTRSVRVEAAAAANRLAGVQADAVALGALRYVQTLLDGTDGQPTFEDTFAPAEGSPVGDGLFWLLAPDLGDDRTQAFGLRGEASRLNLNTATQDMLLKLPA